MHVLVDGQAVAVSGPTIGAALVAARGAAEAAGRVVIEATLDGVAIPDETLADPPGDEFAGAEVVFVTADPRELVGSTLRGVAEVLADARVEQGLAADFIQRGEMDKALPRIGAALAIWDQVRAAVMNGSSLLGMNLGMMEFAAPEGRTVSVDAAVRSLAVQLAEIKRAFIAQDWSALSDALAYDMQEQAGVWEGLLAGLAGAVEAGAPVGRGV